MYKKKHSMYRVQYYSQFQVYTGDLRMHDPQMVWGNTVYGKRDFADVVTISNWLTES